MRVGIWGHGRHTLTENWERLVWGNKEQQRLGTLPMMVLAALNEGLAQIESFGFGTGASHTADGRPEAVAMKELLLNRCDQLKGFDRIRNHPQLRGREGWGRLHRLIDTAVTDTVSKNTAEEISQASKLFNAQYINKVVAVANGSHAPRCIAEQVAAMHTGIIPLGQRWLVVADEMLYEGSKPHSTLVIEEWHRGTNPCSPFSMPDVLRQIFELPQDMWPKALKQVQSVFEQLKP